jgi:hypothetical protein
MSNCVPSRCDEIIGECAPSRGGESIGEGCTPSADSTAQCCALSDKALLLRRSDGRRAPFRGDESVGKDLMGFAGPAAQLGTFSASIIMSRKSVDGPGWLKKADDTRPGTPGRLRSLRLDFADFDYFFVRDLFIRTETTNARRREELPKTGNQDANQRAARLPAVSSHTIHTAWRSRRPRSPLYLYIQLCVPKCKKRCALALGRDSSPALPPSLCLPSSQALTIAVTCEKKFTQNCFSVSFFGTHR